ncbi:MAG: DUF2298 domain-containing protein, partial [Chloroflexota bacterium]|nr:DUF2298 domain-containing protein [Chloroflexota bacterium]
EALFLAAFLSFLVVRAANPDLWHPFRGGEKPMEFAYLNAVFRSTYMPPYDPWFAGGAMNYYYWGYFVVAGLMKALGIDPSVGYNLAVPLLYALTTLGAFAIVYNVTEGLRRARGGAARWAWGPVAAGLVAAAFVVVIGNLDGLVQLVQGRWSNFDFWRSSRMIPELANQTHSALRFWLPGGQNVARDISPHITEFPFFTFLFADLHAHMMSLPFTLLAIGLALALLLQLRSGAGLRALAPTAVALAVAVGALAPINTWDYPGYVALAVAAVGAGVVLRQGSARERVGLFLAVGAGVVAASLLAWFPYHLRYEAPASGIEVSKWATPLWSYLGQFGLFVFVLGSFLAIEWWRNRSALRGRWWLAGVALTAAVAVYLAVAGYWTAAVLVIPLAAVTGLGLRTLAERDERTPYRLFPLLLAGLALSISFGVEFVRLKPDIGRMNTQFKLYLEVWVLLALASAYILWWMGSERGLFSFNRGAVAKGVWLGALAALLLGSLVYPVLGTRARLADRFNVLPLTLDGTAYMRQAIYRDEHGPIRLEWDRQAIQWLKENVRGTPVVLEGFTTQYRWGARIADNTGLPTLLG